MSRSSPVPKYRLHKPSGQAVITIRTASGDRRDIYLGLHNSEESRREYARIIGELATGAPPEKVAGGTPDPTVDELLLAFWVYAAQHYRRPDGTPTNELVEYRYTLKPLRALYGHTAAKDFGPLALKTVRGAMVATGWARTLVNARVGRIKRAFKWAASEQLIPVTTYTALATVAGLQAGRTEACETEPIGLVDAATVGATLPYLNRQVAGLVAFQRLTGCRPGEACQVRRCDIDQSREVWFYTPAQHKTAHKGKRRVVAIGPRAQEVLRQFFGADPEAYLFDPRKAVAEMRATRFANRTTPDYPSAAKRKLARRVLNPKRRPRARYTAQAYAVAVKRAVTLAVAAFTEAGVDLELHPHHWHPNQLRHSHATEVRRRFGLEGAQVAMGHAKADVTQVYAERDDLLAAKVAAEMG